MCKFVLAFLPLFLLWEPAGWCVFRLGEEYIGRRIVEYLHPGFSPPHQSSYLSPITALELS